MAIADVLGFDHVDLTVNDLERAIAFYGKVLGALGFRRVEHATYVAWANGHTSIGLYAAGVPGAVDRRGAGFHHAALRVKSRAQVDAFHRFLVEERVTILDPPAEYPQYGPEYYAVFFADPDGMKLEVVHFPWGYWRVAMTDGRDDRPRQA
jgi:catechol 2,3-dioxygenase-like lactoylglutathione lyase family enzyme